MGQAIGGLLPSAVGVALSPIPIIAVILMLDTPRARSNGPTFAAGWIVGLVVVSVVVIAAASGANHSDSPKSTSVDWITLVLGLVFFQMAIRQWRKRPRPGVETPMPKWMQTIDGVSPVKSLGLGVLLSGINPKNLALTAAAAASIAQAGLSGGGTTVVVVVFVLIGSITVAGPVIFYLVLPDRAAGPLESIKEFMSDHNAVIMMIVLLVLGAKLLGNGIAGLTS